MPRRSPTSLANQSRTNGWILDLVDTLRTNERAVVGVGTDKPVKTPTLARTATLRAQILKAGAGIRKPHTSAPRSGTGCGDRAG